MVLRNPTLGDKLRYIFAPADAKGVGFFDRLVLATRLGTEDAWMARPEVEREKYLIDLAAALSPKMGITTPPQIIMYRSDYPNAASTMAGRGLMASSVFDIMTPPEVKALLAHELSHHRHKGRDALVMWGAPIGYCAGREILAP